MSYNYTAEQERKLAKQFKQEHIQMMRDTDLYVYTIFILLTISAFSFSMISVSKFYIFTVSLMISSLIGGSLLIFLLAVFLKLRKEKQRNYTKENIEKLKEQD